MDVSGLLELNPAPRVVFAQRALRGSTPRFMVRSGDDWEPVTWEEFAAAIERCALWLDAAGLQPGDRLAILAGNSVEWIVAALAIQAVGGTMVPVYPSCTPDQVAHVLGHSGTRGLFVAPGGLESAVAQVFDQLDGALERVVRLPGGASHAVPDALSSVAIDWHDVQTLGESLVHERPERIGALLDAIDLDAPALMLYTSGTTGPPKGVPLTHRNVGVNGRDWLECNGPALDDDGVDVLWLPLSHVFGFGEACLGNTLGWTTWMASPVDVLGLLPELRPTVFMSVPRYWEKLAEMAADGASMSAEANASLRTLTGGRLSFCLSGGAGLKREVKERFLDAGMLIIEGYGLTEASPTLTLNRPDDFRFDTVGKALPSVELRLAADGEIQARGPSIFDGYYNDPEATAACFTDDGWLATGDLGEMTDDGFLRIIGRKKEILVTAGENVPPANIELQFADDPVIGHVVVYGDGKPCLVAGVWLDPLSPAAGGPRDDVEAAIARRIDAVNETLARHERLKAWTLIDDPLTIEAGLLTPTLKVRRKHVYDRFRDRFEALYAS